MELSSFTLNFQSLNLLDVNFVSEKQASFDDSSQETTLEDDLKSQANTSDASTKNKSEKNLKIISLDEVAWHDTINDCWLVIYDYVYDCTNFMKNHPGGQDVLLEYGGRDATLAFVGSGHPPGVNRILEKLLIGELPVHERIFRTSNGIKIGDYV